MSTQPRLDFAAYTVAWIAPLEIEARAARLMLDNQHHGVFPSKRGDGFLYTGGDINGHNVVIATFPADHPYGTTSAAALASDLKVKFPNLWFGLLVGVSAGLPNLSCDPPLDIRLGDVLVACGVGDEPAIVNYQFGKETQDGFHLSPRGALPRTEQIVRAAFGRIKGEGSENSFAPYYKDIEATDSTFAYPGAHEDRLYRAFSLVEREPRPRSARTKAWYGAIGSGDTLMRNAQRGDELSTKYKVIGLEMEAAGVMGILPVGVIRGVSDYADDLKTKRWQPYAALTASAYAKRVLYEILPERTPQKGASYDLEQLVPPSLSSTEAEQQLECLRSLSFANIDSRRNNISPAQHNTCNWLFETEQFQRWKNCRDLPDHHGILWVKGKAGSGKSTLMKQALKYSREKMPEYVTAAYFFNARGSELEQTPLGMFRSLVFSLVDSLPSLFRSFYNLFQTKRKKHGDNWDWEIGELQDFLLSELGTRRQERILILIDALDECNEKEVRKVAKFVEQLGEAAYHTDNVVNICLSSRHYPNISISKNLDLHLETQQDHDNDIYKYVVHNLRTTNQEIRHSVVEKANHTFMWVVLVIEMLNKAFDDGRERAMRRKLEEVPSDLEDVYSSILEKENEDKQEALLLLQWVLFAEEKLSTGQLYFAVLAGTDPDALGPWDRSRDSPETISKFIINTSKGLVEIHQEHDGPKVQFIHQSVPDFLLRNKRLSRLDPALEEKTVAKCHDRLANICITYAEAACQSPNANMLIEEYSELYLDPWFKQYPLLDYILYSVFYHANEAQKDGVDQGSLLERLHSSSSSDRIKKLLYLTAHEPLDLTSYGKTSGFLCLASFYGCEHIVSLCLQTNLDVNIVDEVFGSALQAASLEGHLDVVRLLVSHKADINAQGGEYGTALQIASAEGSVEIVRLLLQHNANVNLQGGYYGTALQAASANGRKDIIRLLLQNNADINLQGGYYGTALQAASANSLKDIVRLLLQNNADVNLQGGHYGSALQAASARGSVEVIRLLLQHNTNVNLQGGYYGTALQAASANSHNDIVRLLLQNNANVNLQGGHYGSALQAASAYDRLDIVRLLLRNKASVNIQGGGYGTALNAAKTNRHTEIVKLLLEAGANDVSSDVDDHTDEDELIGEEDEYEGEDDDRMIE